MEKIIPPIPLKGRKGEGYEDSNCYTLNIEYYLLLFSIISISL
jgi:hypothetical protein